VPAGYYICDAAHRGRGYGKAIFDHAMAYAAAAGARTVGLDGVPEQVRNYERSGFVAAYRHRRFTWDIAAADSRGASASAGGDSDASDEPAVGSGRNRTHGFRQADVPCPVTAGVTCADAGGPAAGAVDKLLLVPLNRDTFMLPMASAGFPSSGSGGRTLLLDAVAALDSYATGLQRHGFLAALCTAPGSIVLAALRIGAGAGAAGCACTDDGGGGAYQACAGCPSLPALLAATPAAAVAGLLCVRPGMRPDTSRARGEAAAGGKGSPAAAAVGRATPHAAPGVGTSPSPAAHGGCRMCDDTFGPSALLRARQPAEWKIAPLLAVDASVASALLQEATQAVVAAVTRDGSGSHDAVARGRGDAAATHGGASASGVVDHALPVPLVRLHIDVPDCNPAAMAWVASAPQVAARACQLPGGPPHASLRATEASQPSWCMRMYTHGPPAGSHTDVVFGVSALEVG